MADFSWQAELAARPADDPLLLDRQNEWRPSQIITELVDLRDPLLASRVVGILADNGPAWVIADLACQDAGRVQLPLPAFFHAAQLRHALAQSGADTVLTDQPQRIGALDLGFAITGSWQGLIWMRRVVEPVALPADTTKISFTSGSTGAPKGVCLSATGLLDTARAIRQRLADLPLERHLAVLLLTARDAIEDKIAGLDGGADDYLAKPFDLGELQARIRALLRRAGGTAQPLLEHAGVRLDPASKRVSFEGREVALSGREYALLQVLLSHPGHIRSRSQLEDSLYAWGDETDSNTVEVYIHHLRKKFGAQFIRTIRGLGYQLTDTVD